MRPFKDAAVRVTEFYDRHPISEAHVLAAVARRRGSRTGPLTPEDLFDFDQDHYGGLDAVATLARLARIGLRSRVLDLCAGLAGPARFIAWSIGCRVTAVELSAARAGGAARLTRMVGLRGRVAVARGNALALPFATGRFDACLSQEALLHIRDKAAVLAECHRVLAPGGRLAFTDWIARPRLGQRERVQLETWMAATTLQTLGGYRTLVGRVGFRSVEAEDLSDDWRRILRGRLELHRALRDDVVARLGRARYDEYQHLYAFFVGLVEDGKLGGGRLTATR